MCVRVIRNRGTHIAVRNEKGSGGDARDAGLRLIGRQNKATHRHGVRGWGCMARGAVVATAVLWPYSSQPMWQGWAYGDYASGNAAI